MAIFGGMAIFYCHLKAWQSYILIYIKDYETKLERRIFKIEGVNLNFGLGSKIDRIRPLPPYKKREGDVELF